jgi:putative ABC transport system substrate-binding protein
MRRRDFITILGGALTGALSMPRSPAAQDRPDMLRVGTVSLAPRSRSIMQFFEQRMRELGYIEGQNYTFDFVDLQGRADRIDAATQELVRRNVDIIIAAGPEAPLKAAVAATKTIPIVMIAIDFDPFARGYVTSLARPSGNVTGLFFEQIELAAKRLQLLKDAFPAKHAATVFWDQLSADQWEVTKATAQKLGWQLAGVELTEVPYDYERALAKAPPDHREVLIPMTSPLFARDREVLARFALRHRMVSMFVFREYVELGGLMSYGPSRTVMTRRAADYVNRIARGAKPADLPIERPNTFETVINLKTAKALGLEFSQAMLLRADDVIE